jgi:hypothetical protein
MKKILLGLVAGLSLLAFTVPARAQDTGGDKAPAEGAPKKAKKAKKSKTEKTEGDKGADKPAAEPTK